MSDQPNAIPTPDHTLRASKLFPVVYNELHDLARRNMKRERASHTLQATALVHEAYERLSKGKVTWSTQEEFFHAAANAMRHILIDHARKRTRLKRGGGREREGIDIDSVADMESGASPEQVLALEEAMGRLAVAMPEAERIVNLKFFAGLEIAQIADMLAISTSTVKRKWDFARAWLAREMQGTTPDRTPPTEGADAP